MVGSASIKQGRSANRKHTYFFFLALEALAIYKRYVLKAIGLFLLSIKIEP